MAKRRVTKFCIDCGARLIFYPNLSNQKAPNAYRVLVYACPDCTDNFEKPTLIKVQRIEEKDPLRVITLEIIKARKI